MISTNNKVLRSLLRQQILEAGEIQGVEAREIPGYEFYFALADGRIASIMKGRIAFLSPGKCRNGYLQVGPSVNGVHKTVLAHLLVILAFQGPRPEDKETRHKNGNKQDNRIENLEYCSAVENAADKKLHGTYHFGSLVNCSKLTEEAVREIIPFVLRNGRGSMTVAAKRHGVTLGNISYLMSRKTWKHVWSEFDQSSNNLRLS